MDVLIHIVEFLKHGAFFIFILFSTKTITIKPNRKGGYIIISSHKASLEVMTRDTARQEAQSIADMLVEPLLESDAQALGQALSPLRHKANILRVTVTSNDGAVQASVLGKATAQTPASAAP